MRRTAVALTPTCRSFLVIDSARKVLWTQCSDQVCASISSSISTGLTALPAVVVLDGAHLGQVERQATLPADGFEARGIGSRQRDGFTVSIRRLREGEGRCDPAVDRVGLDDGIGK